MIFQSFGALNVAVFLEPFPVKVCVVVHLPDPVEAGWVEVLLLVPTVTVAARLLTALPALAMETLAMMITRSTSPKHPPPIHNAAPRRFFGGCCGCMGHCWGMPGW